MKKTKLQRLKEKCVKLAIKNKIERYPKCEFCGKPASTCHHFIHQSRSNYLRLDYENLIPICKSCHYKLHSGYEQVFTGQLIKKYGITWYDLMISGSQKTIKDNLYYWENMYRELKGEIK